MEEWTSFVIFRGPGIKFREIRHILGKWQTFGQTTLNSVIC